MSEIHMYNFFMNQITDILHVIQEKTEVHSEPRQTSNTEFFMKIFHDSQPLIIFL